jgi:Kef-type K+ transport system membrane component KefB
METDAYQIIVSLALLLFTAKLFGEAAARLRLPSVLGEIVAGVILGPSILGWVDPSFTIQTISTIGIMLLLFLAGLEIDLDTMRKMGVAALSVAAFGVILPMGIGTLVFRLGGESLRAAFFVGAIMTATSIGLTLRSLMDMGKFRSREGTTVVTAAVIDDVIGIFILTLLVSFVTAGELPSPLHILELLGIIFFFFTAVLALGFWGSKWLTGLVSRMWVDEALVALSICFAIALGWLASNAKVAEITGAFLAGLVLNPTREKRAIADRLNVIGYGFFIPIFFAYIGVSTKLGALPKAGVMSIFFILIAIFGKIIGCGAGARPWFDTRRSLAIGVGMIPRAEVALIMATIGLQTGVIGDEIFVMTILMVFVTNLLTPILLKLAFRWAEGKTDEQCEEEVGTATA